MKLNLILPENCEKTSVSSSLSQGDPGEDGKTVSLTCFGCSSATFTIIIINSIKSYCDNILLKKMVFSPTFLLCNNTQGPEGPPGFPGTPGDPGLKGDKVRYAANTEKPGLKNTSDYYPVLMRCAHTGRPWRGSAWPKGAPRTSWTSRTRI